MNSIRRTLLMYERLLQGERLHMSDLVDEFGLSIRQISRYIEEIETHLQEFDSEKTLIRESGESTYSLSSSQTNISAKELLAISKILLHTRAFPAQEMKNLNEKLGQLVIEDDKKVYNEIILDELSNFIELKHGKSIFDILWTFSEAIYSKKKASISYVRSDFKRKEHTLWPVSVMFSEFYFYLIAFIEGKPHKYPSVFRLDRIESHVIMKDTFWIPYRDRFNDGEFRKRIQFMYSGPLTRIKFLFHGDSLEAILDRFPVVIKIEERGVNKAELTVEGYGPGMQMWLNSQGDNVEIIDIKDIG